MSNEAALVETIAWEEKPAEAQLRGSTGVRLNALFMAGAEFMRCAVLSHHQVAWVADSSPTRV